MNTLHQLHAELAGKIVDNKKEAARLRTAMTQVEAVMKLLQPDFSVQAIAAKRRNADNPWFKRGTLYRAVLDVLRTATEPMTAEAICRAVLDGKEPAPTKRQETNLQAAILALLRKRMGNGVERIGVQPFKWRLTAAE